MKIIPRVAGVLIAVLLPTVSRSQEVTPATDASTEAAAGAETAEPPRWTERIVVSATRSAIALSEIPMHAMVLDAEEIAESPQFSVSDLMLEVPSLSLRTNVNSLMSSPRDGTIGFRGLAGLSAQSRGLVLVDGLPLNDPYGSVPSWNSIPKHFVSRIEIIPGSGSGVWGNLALSGVVNLITRSPSDRLFTGSLQAAEYGTSEVSGSYTDLGSNWSGWIGASRVETDGLYQIAAAQRGRAIVRSAKDFGSLSGRLGRSFSDRRSFHVGGSLYSEDRIEDTVFDTAHSHEQTANASLDLVAGGGSSWQIRAFTRQIQFTSELASLGSGNETATPSSGFAIPSQTTGTSATWATSGTSRHALKIGADVQLSRVDRRSDLDWNGAIFQRTDRIGGDQQLFGLFLQDLIEIGQRTSLLVGARLDSIRARNAFFDSRVTLTGESLDGRAFDDNTEKSFSPSVGMVRELNARARLRLSVYTGFRAATPSELWVPTASRNPIWPNPELQPEELVGAELGLDLSLSRNASLRLTGFRNEIDSLVDRIEVGRNTSGPGIIEPCGLLGSGARCRVRVNLGEVATSGLDLEAEVRAGSHWRMVLQGNLLDTEIVSAPADPEIEGNRLIDAPNAGASFTAYYRHPRFLGAMLRARYRGSRYDDTENLEIIASHVLVDVSLSRPIRSSWEIFVGAQNLFQESYVISYGSDGDAIGAPRIARFGVRFRSR